ncbi:unnamed protein product [Mytilus edulis]|uniref:MKRN2 opposite strand protein-like C-terminal domain-containing protein n=1 Tax=Mytilus edulis TaxID=6550 RepID=A0A8S3TU24_MYTED|nr:unnamed protein product [Mytilus edulis]
MYPDLCDRIDRFLELDITNNCIPSSFVEYCQKAMDTADMDNTILQNFNPEINITINVNGINISFVHNIINHLKKNGLKIPVVCPLCGVEVACTPCRIPPYIISTPLVNAKEYPCSVIIKPTVGTFLQNYSNNSDLHVGVTDSGGCTYDFNEEGVNVGSVWNQCVVIRMINEDYNLQSQWDYVLRQIVQSQTWSRSRYNENSHNCFDLF